MQTFYDGVNPNTRQMIDAAERGTLNTKTPAQIKELVEEMALNNYQWQVTRNKPIKSRIYEVDMFTNLNA